MRFVWDRWPRRHFLSSRDTRENKNSSFAVLSTSRNESADVPSMRKKNVLLRCKETEQLHCLKAKILREERYAKNTRFFTIKINIQILYIAHIKIYQFFTILIDFNKCINIQYICRRKDFYIFF